MGRASVTEVCEWFDRLDNEEAHRVICLVMEEREKKDGMGLLSVLTASHEQDQGAYRAPIPQQKAEVLLFRRRA